MPTREKIYNRRLAIAELGYNPSCCFGSGGGGSTQSTVTQTNVPDWLQEDVLGSVGAAWEIASEPYTPYTGPRVAGLDPNQQAAYQSTQDTFGNMPFVGDAATGNASVFNTAQQFLNYQPNQVGTSYNPMNYNPTQFSTDYMSGIFGANPINAQNVNSQYYFDPNSAYTRLGDINGDYDANAGFLYGPEVNTGIWSKAKADYYADPYAQAVTDIAKREATRDSEIMREQNYAQAEQAGAYGGSRQAIIEAERQRNLGQNLTDIETKGLEAAYLNAQQQYERDRAARLQADLANQQAYYTGLSGYEGSRQFGGNFGLDALRLSDASNQFGANLSSQAAQMYADYAMKAAMANQAAGLDASKTDAANQLTAQQLAEQANQFGAQNWLQYLQAQEAANQYGAQFDEASMARLNDYLMQSQLANQQAGLSAQQLGLSALSPMLGASQQQAGLAGLTQDIYNAQLQNLLSTGDMNRMLEQAYYDTAYTDWLNQQDYPRQTLNWLTGIIRGYPYTSQTQTYMQPSPNPYSQLLGGGLSAAALMNLMG